MSLHSDSMLDLCLGWTTAPLKDTSAVWLASNLASIIDGGAQQSSPHIEVHPKRHKETEGYLFWMSIWRSWVKSTQSKLKPILRFHSILYFDLSRRALVHVLLEEPQTRAALIQSSKCLSSGTGRLIQHDMSVSLGNSDAGDNEWRTAAVIRDDLLSAFIVLTVQHPQDSAPIRSAAQTNCMISWCFVNELLVSSPHNTEGPVPFWMEFACSPSVSVHFLKVCSHSPIACMLRMIKDPYYYLSLDVGVNSIGASVSCNTSNQYSVHVCKPAA